MISIHQAGVMRIERLRSLKRYGPTALFFVVWLIPSWHLLLFRLGENQHPFFLFCLNLSMGILALCIPYIEESYEEAIKCPRFLLLLLLITANATATIGLILRNTPDSDVSVLWGAVAGVLEISVMGFYYEVWKMAVRPRESWGSRQFETRPPVC